MHECYAMQILEKKKKQKKKKKKKKQQQQQQRGMITKNREIKYKDHVRKTQLDQAFCIQNFLNATLALEVLFILEC